MRRNRAWSDPVKIKAKSARNILSDYEDDFDMRRYDSGG